MWLVKNLMAKEIMSVDIRTTIADTVLFMRKNNIGAVLVMDGGRLAGIFTDRDLVTKVVPDYEGRLKTTLIDVVMTKDMMTVSPEHTCQKAMTHM